MESGRIMQQERDDDGRQDPRQRPPDTTGLARAEDYEAELQQLEGLGTSDQRGDQALGAYLRLRQLQVDT
jgi:hypothetical protein